MECRVEVGLCQADLARAVVVCGKWQPGAGRGKNHPFQPGPHGFAPCYVGEERPKVTQRCREAAFAAQHMAATGCDDVQAVAAVLQHLTHAAIVESTDCGPKLRTDTVRRGAFLPRG